jgi:L-galactose dehydrogenase/L-glyceraldehyde 3-phosphate reductase
MHYRPLGSTGLNVSAIAFGAGPVPATMTSDDPSKQVAVVARAIDRGINWFDTAAGYGQGKSEGALGRALRELGAGERVHVATKVRLGEYQLSDISGAVRRSVEQSLSRLGLGRITLLQLHNSVTAGRGDEPTSLTPADVLGSGGVRDAMEKLKAEGIVAHVGLTGIGQPAALKEVIHSGRFQTMQVPYNLLNPSAGREMPPTFDETNYDNVIADCAAMDMGVFAIRVLAGGALAGHEPSGHTLKTPFFPLALYERDLARANRSATQLPDGITMPEAAIRFALSHPSVASAIVGFSEPHQIDEAVAWAGRGKLVFPISR